MTPLADLDARFIRYVEEAGTIRHRVVDTIDEAQGIIFLCPKCFTANGGAIGTHSVICWSSSRGVPDSARPGPGRWAIEGTSIDDLTLNGDRGRSRSVLLQGGCGWHGFVTDGKATEA
jgi:hypothetical protein